jgi:DNA polymerase III epsilon subunit-like protein
VKEYIVRPSGFMISDKAANYHKISNEKAITEGLPLEDILAEFIKDVRGAVAKGGRVVAHNLEFQS